MNVLLIMSPFLEFAIVFFIILVVCHISCLECSKTLKTNCISCYSDRYFYKNQCLLDCPEMTYPTHDQIRKICLHCVSPCETCLSKTECIRCLEGFFKDKEKDQCVVGSNCTFGTYPDFHLRECVPCDFSCESCLGPSSKNCLTCNYYYGYAMNNEGCIGLQCPSNQYLRIDHELMVAKCQNCHSYCKECKGEGSSNCLDCAKGYIKAPLNKSADSFNVTNGIIKCIPCPVGYFASNNECKGNLLIKT